MELTYDWRSFQSVFYPQRRALSPTNTSIVSSNVFAVIDKNTVVAAYANGKNLSDYLGVSVETLRSALGGQQVIAIERDLLDQWVSGAIAAPHLHLQLEHLRESMAGAKVDAGTCFEEKHFMLEAILGSWSKMLPSAFGVFIRLEKAPAGHSISPELFEVLGNRCKEYLDHEQDLLVLVRGKKLEAFYEPDLSPVGAERRHICGEVVKYLSEKHSVPVQGLTVPYIDWMAWNHSDQPWREFAVALKARSAKMVPLRWQLTGLLGLRAAFDF